MSSCSYRRLTLRPARPLEGGQARFMPLNSDELVGGQRTINDVGPGHLARVCSLPRFMYGIV